MPPRLGIGGITSGTDSKPMIKAIPHYVGVFCLNRLGFLGL
jgi:hypothetical protein